VAGSPADGAFSTARGYIGIGFRLQNGPFEYIYLRPANGRAEDQLRRNHSTQYSEYPISALQTHVSRRLEYMSYVDIEPGVWTRFRITVEGMKARLYVNDSKQPCLIVNDLKLGDSSGGVALWIGPGTEGFFTGLQIKAAQ